MLRKENGENNHKKSILKVWKKKEEKIPQYNDKANNDTITGKENTKVENYTSEIKEVEKCSTAEILNQIASKISELI